MGASCAGKDHPDATGAPRPTWIAAPVGLLPGRGAPLPGGDRIVTWW